MLLITCSGSPPPNKKVEAAKGPDDMFMLFELTYPVPLSGYKIAIDSAKLRLFKIYQVCYMTYIIEVE